MFWGPTFLKKSWALDASMRYLTFECGKTEKVSFEREWRRGKAMKMNDDSKNSTSHSLVDTLNGPGTWLSAFSS